MMLVKETCVLSSSPKEKGVSSFKEKKISFFLCSYNTLQHNPRVMPVPGSYTGGANNA